MDQQQQKEWVLLTEDEYRVSQREMIEQVAAKVFDQLLKEYLPALLDQQLPRVFPVYDHKQQRQERHPLPYGKDLHLVESKDPIE